MTADAVSILSTPTIQKVKSNVSSFRLDADSTPTSILKVTFLHNIILQEYWGFLGIEKLTLVHVHQVAKIFLKNYLILGETAHERYSKPGDRR